MHNAAVTIAQHGYAVIFLAVLFEAIGLPIPAALAMVVAGAACASHAMNLPAVFVICLFALVCGDFVMYTLGRYTGWALLGILCRVSVNPETCILRSAESFYKRGKITLVMAKFGNNIVDSTIVFGYSSVHGEQDHDRTKEPSRSNSLFLESR